jgi:hypothetical protein
LLDLSSCLGSWHWQVSKQTVQVIEATVFL